MRPAAESRAARALLPGVLRVSSDDLGWSWPLVQVFDQPASAEEFTTLATRDVSVVMVVLGQYRLESRDGPRWRAARYVTGTVGVTPPGHRDVLRWRDPADDSADDAGTRTTVHVHLPPAVVEHAANGRPRVVQNSLDLDDPVVRSIVGALHTALLGRAEPLVAEPLALALGARLLDGGAGPRPSELGLPTGPRLSTAALSRVVDHLHAHLDRPVGLEDLAREAHLSKYHFLRLFRATVGTTPHRYLTELRMQRAAELLLDGRHTVSSVAARCGYASDRRFTTVFHRRFGTTPGAYRAR